MKCPKCQYISFDSQARCRNCGYEFALAVDMALDLPIQTGDEAIGPFGDLALADRAGPKPAAPSRSTLAAPANPRDPSTASDHELVRSPALQRSIGSTMRRS